MPPWRQRAELRGDRVAQVRVEQVEQLGRGLLGLDVDRDPGVLAGAVDDMDLEVRRVGRALAAALDGPRDQHAVSVERHDVSP
jgi:hypothetical protein